VGKILCRRAQTKDWQDIREIELLSFEDLAAHPGVVDELRDETWFATGNWAVCELDGKVVSVLGLRPGVMWMQGAAIPTGTIGIVGTRPELRGKGIGMELVRFAGELAAEQGLVLTRLHTWASRYAFYRRAGYVKAITGHPAGTLDVTTVSSDAMKRAEADLGDALIRPAEPRDAMRLNDIYEATFSHVTGAISRNEHFFLRRIARRPKVWLWTAPRLDVVETRAEGVVAYSALALDSERQDLLEIACLQGFSRMARPLVLRAAREARSAGFRKLNTYLDRLEPLGWLIHEFRIDLQPDASVLFLKVHDEERFLELVLRILERACIREEAELTLHLAGHEPLVVGAGQPVGLVTDVAHLASLIYSGTWLSGLLGQGAISIEPDTVAAHRLVMGLFPDTHAYRCRMDGY
jgi:predicted N-acetyltransferase YhbS